MRARVALCGHIVAEVAASGEAVRGIRVDGVVQAVAAEEREEGVCGIRVHDKDDNEESDDHSAAEVGSDLGVVLALDDERDSRGAVGLLISLQEWLPRSCPLESPISL